MKILLAALLLSGCVAPTKYWVRPGTDIRTTARDLFDCRTRANNGGQKVFPAFEMEMPCMVAQGYALSDAPATR